MQIAYTERAGTDLQGIFNNISETNPSAAVRTLQEIDAACARLSDLPLRVRVGRRPDTRELTIVWPYLIV